jgi:hypothetical protein
VRKKSAEPESIARFFRWILKRELLTNFLLKETSGCGR